LNSFTTLYELVYSYRNTADIKFPGFGSKEAIDAAKMIKQIKEEISSGNINNRNIFFFFFFFYFLFPFFFFFFLEILNQFLLN